MYGFYLVKIKCALVMQTAVCVFAPNNFSYLAINLTRKLFKKRKSML